MIFTPFVGGRSPRGVGIAASIWGSLAATSQAIAPPLWVSAVGVLGLLGALALYHWAAFSIRGRTFSYAGNQDLPQFVHQSGPYAYIRNPFYASYLLAELSTTVMWPTIWGALVVALAAGYFEWLARFEEGKFDQSPVAAEYAHYKARTGRLFPRVF
jgi:protein-S-isoprenylcysteine O-methyltransferase Ste14